ncbi:MAG: O-antigen ligase family protein [Saprospiraceae bacterium]
MYNTARIHIDLYKILHFLFCCYAFSMPFELLFEVVFDVKTIFKPFRVFSLLIIGTYGIQVLKNGMELRISESSDLFLYIVFIYGLLISFIQIVLNPFSLPLFYNDLFLVGLNVIVFFVYKAIAIDKNTALKILRYFAIGIGINVGYIIYNVFLKIEHGRQAGFIDNPNYAALGLVAVMSYLMIRLNFDRKFWIRFSLVGVLLAMLYVFIITGSRAGLVLFGVSLILLFLFSSLRRKLMLLIIGIVVVFQLMAIGSKYLYFGGSLVLINRINNKLDSETEDVRFVIWRGIFRTLEDRSYWGMGIGQFKNNFAKNYSEESNKLILEIVNRGYYLSPHNDYLAILADYGLPALLSYLLFLFFSIRVVWRRLIYPKEDSEDSRFLNQYSFIILLCLAVYGMTAESFQHQLYWFLLMFSTKKYI